MKKLFTLTLASISMLLISLSAFAQKTNPDGSITGTPWTSPDKPTLKNVGEMMEYERTHKIQIKARVMFSHLLHKEHEFDHKPYKTQNPNSPNSLQYPEPIKDKNGKLPAPLAALNTLKSNFLAITSNESAGFPPDVNGDVSDTQVGVFDNGRVKFYNKNASTATPQTTATGANSTPLASTASFTTATLCNNDASVSDPHIRYDRLSDRWFFTMIGTSTTPNRIYFAVTNTTGNVTAATTFTVFNPIFTAIGGTPTNQAGGFYDYPTLGVDRNALYIGGSIFNAAGNAVVGENCYVINKAAMIAGTLTATCFGNIGSAGGSGAGMWTPQGVHNDDPTSTEGYFIGVSNTAFGQLVMRRVTTPGGTPTLSADINITVPATASPTDVVALGSATALDALDDRLYAAMMMRNKYTGAQTLWTAHNVLTATSIRWYQIGTLTATPTLVQSGTLSGTGGAADRAWIGTTASNGQGHALIGGTVASTTTRADVISAERYNIDPAGTQRAGVRITAASTTYAAGLQNGNYRWGDYSQVVIDPSDNQTTWSFQEYVANTNVYGIRASQYQAPEPPRFDVQIYCSKQYSYMDSVVLTPRTTEAITKQFFDPGNDISASIGSFIDTIPLTGTIGRNGPGFANRMRLSITGGPSTPNIFQLRLHPNTSTWKHQVSFLIGNVCNIEAGKYAIAVTNPDGQGGLPAANANFDSTQVNLQPRPRFLTASTAIPPSVCVSGNVDFSTTLCKAIGETNRF